MIPPLFGEITRGKPDLGANGGRDALENCGKSTWKTLAVIGCKLNDAASKTYRLTLRGTDSAGYTWDDTAVEGDKVFGDFNVDVKEKSFLYKYLTPMIHVFTDSKPMEVRKDLRYPDKTKESDIRSFDVLELQPMKPK